MAVFIEKRLNDQIQAASDTEIIEAVIVVRERENALASEGDGDLAGRMVDRAAQHTGELPRAVRYFPRANAVVLSASRRFLLDILEDENVAAASTTSVEVFPFSGLKSVGIDHLAT